MSKSGILNSIKDETPESHNYNTPNSTNSNYSTPNEGIKERKSRVNTTTTTKTEFISEMDSIRKASIEKENKRRSRAGCITCKLRKKRCDELKPTCGDCSRLKRQCVYIDDAMSPEEIKILKLRMEVLEGQSKTRKRKPKGAKTNTDDSPANNNTETPKRNSRKRLKTIEAQETPLENSETPTSVSGYTPAEFDALSNQQAQTPDNIHDSSVNSINKKQSDGSKKIGKNSDISRNKTDYKHVKFDHNPSTSYNTNGFDLMYQQQQQLHNNNHHQIHDNTHSQPNSFHHHMQQQQHQHHIQQPQQQQQQQYAHQQAQQMHHQHYQNLQQMYTNQQQNNQKHVNNNHNLRSLEEETNKVVFNPLSFDLMGAYSPSYNSFATPEPEDFSSFATTPSSSNTAILHNNTHSNEVNNPTNSHIEKQGNFKKANNLHRETLINSNAGLPNSAYPLPQANPHNNNNNNNNNNNTDNINHHHVEQTQRQLSQKHHVPLDSDFSSVPYTSAWDNSSNLIPVLASPNLVAKGRPMGRYGTPPASFPAPNHNDHHNSQTAEEEDDRYTPLSEIFSPGFSKVFQEHLQALEEEHHQGTLGGSNKSNLGGHHNYDRKHSVGSISSVLDLNDVKKNDLDNLTEVIEFQSSKKSLDLSKEESSLDDENSPTQVSTVTSSDLVAASVNLTAYENYLQRQQFNNPKIYVNPSIVRSSPLASLPPIGIRLYEYYRDNLSHRISTLPNEQNNYLTTILPMAHIDYGVLYGVIALGAFHLGGGKMEKYGNYFLQNAIKHFQKNPVLENEKDPDFYKDVIDDKVTYIDENNTSPFEEVVSLSSSPEDIKNQIGNTTASSTNSTSANAGMNENTTKIEPKSVMSLLSHKDQSNLRLASYLILCAVEICRGDVSKWVKYLEYGAKLIENSGGLTNFNASKDEQFLVASYAYHDMQAATTMHQEGHDGLHFKFSKYEELWSQQTESGLDSLHGLSSKIFKIIAEINILAMQSRINLRKVGNSLSENYFVDLNKDNKENNKEDSDFSSSEDEEVLKNNISVDNVVLDKKKRRRNSNNTANSEENENGDDLSPLNTNEKNSGPIASSSEWLKNQVQNQTREEAEATNEYQTRYEALDEIMMQVNKLETRLNDVKPDESQLSNLSIRDIELQLTAFECFQLTAKIHLRQSIMKINSSSLSTQHLLAQLIRCLDILLGSPIESCLCFPMFIAGMNCISKRDRKTMKNRFNEFIKRYRWKNVLRAKIVMKEVWKKDSNGNKCVDWFEIVRKLGWDLSFA